ncbi:TPA: hypothetical protein ACPFIV_001865 [Klebsiella michiganensis]
MSHRLDATDKQKNRALRHGVKWRCCVFASSLYSGDGAIGSVFSRCDYYKSASALLEEAFTFLVRGISIFYLTRLYRGEDIFTVREAIEHVTTRNTDSLY